MAEYAETSWKNENVKTSYLPPSRRRKNLLRIPTSHYNRSKSPVRIGRAEMHFLGPNGMRSPRRFVHCDPEELLTPPEETVAFIMREARLTGELPDAAVDARLMVRCKAVTDKRGEPVWSFCEHDLEI